MLRRLGWIIPVLLLLSVSAKADTVYFNGGYAFGDHGVGIPPYQGTLDGQNASFYCVDFDHDITGNTSWQVTVTDVTSGADYSGTRLMNQTDYFEIAWLLDQAIASGNQTTQAELQWAVWSFSGGGDPYGTNNTLLTDAANALPGYTPANWEILTPTGTYGQEFMVKVPPNTNNIPPVNTPEPSGFALLSMGLAGLAIAGRRKLVA